MIKIFLCIIFFLQPALASEIYSANQKFQDEQTLLLLENSNPDLLQQKATGCQTVCRKYPNSEAVVCEEICSAPTAGLCERSYENVTLLGCLGGGTMAGLIGLAVGSPLSYGAAGCLLLGGTMFVLKANSNCAY